MLKSNFLPCLRTNQSINLIHGIHGLRTGYFSRYFAEYQTGLQEFYPKLVAYETKIGEGLTVPEVNHSLFRLLVDLPRDFE